MHGGRFERLFVALGYSVLPLLGVSYGISRSVACKAFLSSMGMGNRYLERRYRFKSIQ